ncbi:hypothetical protein BJP34_10380 [Moorena producens PAL-8-15-08-1]|uniref:Uncharacterized protein n=1 Tax=Moorena producens PAL-8-15-08-1 TaxID=1458985 RepID=A0A1D8TQA9_9CYAN|nr:hypothetical protein [Moorena producens]AOW99804.1 hypothetical protein BJP34_10380 [Moorena producens PAL-8-15-08-1]
MSLKVCLLVIYNHKFTKNVPKIEKLYGHRFEHIYHLMPFYQGNANNIIPVFESSACFQGYIAQAQSRLPASDYYVFIGDDVLLHPDLNAQNLIETLGLNPDSGYIKFLIPLEKVSFAWPHKLDVIRKYIANSAWVTYRDEIPSLAMAIAILQAKQIEITGRLSVGNLLAHSFFPMIRREYREYYYEPWRFLEALLFLLKNRSNLKMPYPLLNGYSDFIVVPASVFEKFSHYCGVFGAMDLFVEVAIPTALALSCPKVVTEADTAWHGYEMWNVPEKAAFTEKAQSYDYEISRLFESYFTPDLLYVHPVKLSQWKV